MNNCICGEINARNCPVHQVSEESKWREFKITERPYDNAVVMVAGPEFDIVDDLHVIEYSAFAASQARVKELEQEKVKIAKDAVVLIEQLKAQNKILREALENYTDLHHAPKLEEALADADKVGGV